MIKTKQIFYMGFLTVLVSCASLDSSQTPDLQIDRKNQRVMPADDSPQDSVSEISDDVVERDGNALEEVRYQTVPKISARTASSDSTQPERPDFSDGDVEVSLTTNLSILEFANLVYGDLLELGFSTGSGVETNPGIINFRSPRSMTKSALYDSAESTLALHSISVRYEDGAVELLDNAQLRKSTPTFIPARARSSVPTGLQPVVQFVEIYARDLNEMANLLRRAFPDQNDLAIDVNRTSNSLIIAGLPDDVSTAMDIIGQLDELSLADSTFAVYRARNWSADELSVALESILVLNGYKVTSQQGVTASINLLPIPFTQQIYIFARKPDFLEYAVDMVRMLDADAAPQNSLTTRVYKAKHYKAEDLVVILERVSQFGSDGARAASSVNNASNPGTSGESSGQTTNGKYVVDEQGNRIIFEASREDFAKILKLLRQIDVPASEVLIEVTIAEVTLTDERQTGVELLFQQIGSRGFAVGLGTQGGLGLADGGLLGTFQSGDYVVDFSALATNNQVNVLSTPRIVTKSGSDASIQVGTDVPIILSQSAGISQSGGTTDILQTVQYRETGVILNITPLVLSGDRIDLSISQEVSSAEANANQAIASPIISNRSLQTELTLQDGQSAILGGLIENRYSRGTSGVPLLKDIPLVGDAFKTESLSSTRTVLMVMITPYILESRSDRAQIVDELAEIVNNAFLNQVEDSKTLRKPTTPTRIEPSHVDPTNQK